MVRSLPGEYHYLVEERDEARKIARRLLALLLRRGFRMPSPDHMSVEFSSPPEWLIAEEVK